MNDVLVLPGQPTLLSCWRALAAVDFGPGRLVETPHAVAAVFENFSYFNNAILTSGPRSASVAAESVATIYADAGIDTWALWVLTTTTELSEGSDALGSVGPLVRDETTLVMRRDLNDGLTRDERVTTVSTAALRRLVLDDDVPIDELGVHRDGVGVIGWALVHEGQVVASAYSHRFGSDCGLYAVETAAQWRRRGFAAALVGHILASEYATGARTASLQSTPEGEPLYRSLGFAAVGRYEEWQHRDNPYELSTSGATAPERP